MLLFLDHILYRRAHFVRNELRALRAILAITMVYTVKEAVVLGALLIRNNDGQTGGAVVGCVIVSTAHNQQSASRTK